MHISFATVSCVVAWPVTAETALILKEIGVGAGALTVMAAVNLFQLTQKRGTFARFTGSFLPCFCPWHRYAPYY